MLLSAKTCFNAGFAGMPGLPYIFMVITVLVYTIHGIPSFV